MGMWSTIKGWFNIGGVKVKIQDLVPRVSRSGNTLNAKVALTTKTDKQILKVKYLFLWRKTTGKDAEKKTEQQIYGQSSPGHAVRAEGRRDESAGPAHRLRRPRAAAGPGRHVGGGGQARGVRGPARRTSTSSSRRRR